jgi:hypothetical protein
LPKRIINRRLSIKLSVFAMGISLILKIIFYGK